MNKSIRACAVLANIFILLSAFCFLKIWDLKTEAIKACAESEKEATVQVEKNTVFTDKSEKKENKNQIELIVTAYCSCRKCCGSWADKRPKDENGKDIVYTASGTIATAGKTLAADVSVFCFGTKIKINGIEYVVEDTGSAVKGNVVDVYFENHDEAVAFGRQKALATILEG